MPIYDYRCPNCGVFEMDGRRDERQVECACGMTATRLPFSGIPHLKGETVSHNSIPDPAYRMEAQARHHRETWGDGAKAVELLRKHSYVGDDGLRHMDRKAMNEG